MVKVTVTELAKLSGRTPQYICRLIAAGEIKSVGKSWKKNFVDKQQALGVLATKQKRNTTKKSVSLADLF